MSDKSRESIVIQALQAAERQGCMIKASDLLVVDLIGLMCPEPLMMLRQRVRQGKGGDLLLALATDRSTQRDIPTYCRFTGQILEFECVVNAVLPKDVPLNDHMDIFCFIVRKGI